jgi:hypothetical protein
MTKRRVDKRLSDEIVRGWQSARDITLKSFYRTFIKVEDNKGVIGSHKSMKDRQHNDQKKKGQKDIKRSTKHTHKTEDRVIRTPH